MSELLTFGKGEGMKFRIHYTIKDYEGDSFIVEGETVEECIAQKDKFFEERGLDSNSAWSEELK